MKKITELIPLSKENMGNLLISLIVVALFVIAAILPSYLSKALLDKKIRVLRYQIEEHETLLPLYRSLINAPKGDSSVLIVPASSRLEKTGLDSALKAVSSISDKSGMTVISILPDLDYGTKNAGNMAVNIALRGNLENFRTVLTKLGALPYLNHIEELSIQQKPNTQTLAFKIKIILAMS